MAFVPDNYLTAERALDQIITDATSSHTDVTRGIETITNAHSKLAAMATAWQDAVALIDTEAANNPGDPQWQELKARKDKIVADFLVMRDRARNVRDAANAAS